MKSKVSNPDKEKESRKRLRASCRKRGERKRRTAYIIKVGVKKVCS